MEEILILFIVFVTTVIATALSSMSGGGASVITIPIYLFLGMPYVLAMAIQKVCSAFWVLPASYNYLKEQKVDWKFLFIFGFIGLIGSILGFFVLLNTKDSTLRLIVGILIIILVLYTTLNKEVGIVKKKITSKMKKIVGYFFAIPLGFYETIFGSGNGIMFSIVGFKTRGFQMKEALGYYFAIAFLWVSVAAILLIYKGFYNIPIMAVATVGSIIGGYFGSQFGNYKGNNFIKVMFIAIGLVLGLKLIFNI